MRERKYRRLEHSIMVQADIRSRWSFYLIEKVTFFVTPFLMIKIEIIAMPIFTEISNFDGQIRSAKSAWGNVFLTNTAWEKVLDALQPFSSRVMMAHAQNWLTPPPRLIKTVTRGDEKGDWGITNDQNFRYASTLVSSTVENTEAVAREVWCLIIS